MKHNSTKFVKSVLLLGLLFIVSSCTSNTDLSLETNATKIKENLLEYIGSGLEYQSNGKICLFEDDTSLGAIKVKEENVEGGLFCSDENDICFYDISYINFRTLDENKTLYNIISNPLFDVSNFEINCNNIKYKCEEYSSSIPEVRMAAKFVVYSGDTYEGRVFFGFDDNNDNYLYFEFAGILCAYQTLRSFNILDPNNKYIVSENKNLVISSFFSMVGDIEKKSFVNINDNESIDSLEKASQYAKIIGQDSLYYDGQFLNGNIEGFYLISSSGSSSFIDL